MNPANPFVADESAVIAALHAVAAAQAMLRAKPTFHCLKSGHTNQTWRVVGGELDWIVRVGVGSDARLGIDREREADRFLAPRFRRSRDGFLCRGGSRGQVRTDDKRSRMRCNRLLALSEGVLGPDIGQCVLNGGRPRPLPPPRTSGSGPRA